MRTFTLIVVDDHPLIVRFVKQLCTYHNNIEFLRGFNNPLEAKAFLDHNKVDIVVLDIEMPNMTGLELASFIKPPTYFIFSTSHENFALDGFKLSAVDYLLKPYSYDRFEVAIDRAIRMISLEEGLLEGAEPVLVVKSNYNNAKLVLKEIQYIESIDDYVFIYRDNAQPVKVRKSLKAMLDELPRDKFVRIHRSYIVPYARITGYQKSRVCIGDKELPLSASYKNEFLASMNVRD
jgi:DNA-binding LytR/AlgR family response regulator